MNTLPITAVATHIIPRFVKASDHSIFIYATQGKGGVTMVGFICASICATTFAS